MKEDTRSSKALIAVVDDEPFICDIVKRGLAREYDVDTYCDSQSVLDALESGRRYDLIFCDLRMPGVSGREIYNQVREKWPEQAKKIVFMSGLTEIEAREELIEEEINGNQMLKKPFQLRALRSLTRELIGDE